MVTDELAKEGSVKIPENIYYYPVVVHIIDISKGIDRKFYLDDLKDIKAGIIELTMDEKGMVFRALLDSFINVGNKNYWDFRDEVYNKRIPIDSIKTRA